ncbi:hypothetical protein SJI19_06545 [Acerihabitans sp. TG2]|uniref:hypothetical protein n=1 Tax=Acerihabitans sp. TG2 TaxID=3096008 RepID=UPI002B23211B|nr:hypothetical protein [Acerihabitans sp. TG2]MEA9390210.1 hypothetical protein [Acerihabitans sp. TG2]
MGFLETGIGNIRMKKIHFSDSQIMARLKHAEASTQVSERCGDQNMAMVLIGKNVSWMLVFI